MNPFSVASYNVLADAYVRAEWYPRTPDALLQPGARTMALARHIESLGADIICLQEAEAEAFEAISQRLRARGYEGCLLQKTGKPDGCAIFFRGFALRSRRDLRFADGPPDSGHVALMLVLEGGGGVVGVASTHIKWGPPGQGPRFRQVSELLGERPAGIPWIAGGDFNVTAEDGAVVSMLAADMRDAYAGLPDAYTCNSNGLRKRIDYLFHTPDLTAVPAKLPALEDQTPLPSDSQPSDHLAIMAEFSS